MIFHRTDLEASICRDEFSSFVKRFWDCVIPETHVWSWHMDVLCDELQAVAEDVFAGKPRQYDLVVNIPPGTSKSSICSIMFPAWVWCNMPKARCICASYAHTLAMNLSRLSRMVIKDEVYRRMWPDVQLSYDQDTKGHFSNTAGGMRYCVGIGGSVTGYHGHFLIVDDPLDPNAALSDKELETANNWMTETLPTRKVDKAVTPLILIMQRLHQNDPTGMLLERQHNRNGNGSSDAPPIRHICLPAEESDLIKPVALRKNYVDGLLDPVRLNKQHLADYKPPNLSEFAYAGQFDQSPVPRSGGMFKAGKLRIQDAPGWSKFREVVRYWDKAGTGGGGAFTVGCLMGAEKNGRYWVLDIVRGQWDAAEREDIIQNTTDADAASISCAYRVGVEQEPGSGGKESAQATVRRLAGHVIHVDRPTGDKAMRADPFATQVNADNVLLQAATWNHPYTEEVRFFPNSKYKDQIDSSSGAFAMLAVPRKKVGALVSVNGRRR